MNYIAEQTRLDYRPPVGRNSLTLTCPACNHNIETKLTHKPNMTTHLAAFVLCLMGFDKYFMHISHAHIILIVVSF